MNLEDLEGRLTSLYAEKKFEKYRQDSWCLGWDLNWETSEYK
jgi:hypothetical protein